MRFVTLKENEIPSFRRNMTKLEAELTEFMSMNVKCVKVTFTELEYKHANSAYSSFGKAIKRYAVPVRVFMHQGKLYLMRTDMD